MQKNNHNRTFYLIYKNLNQTIIRQIINLFLSFALIIFLARTLGPEGNGKYALVIFFPTMLSNLLNLGISTSNTYHMASNKVSFTTAFRTSLLFSFTFAVLGICVSVIFLSNRLTYFFPGVSNELIWFGIFLFPLHLMLTNVQSLLLGVQQFKKYNISLLITPFSCLLLAFVFVFLFGLGIKGAVISIILSYIITLLITLFFVYNYHRNVLSSESFQSTIEYLMKAFKFGIKAHIGNVIATLNYRIDLYLVNFYLSPLYTGIYVVSIQLSERIWIISHSVGTVIFPKLSELSLHEEQKKLLTPIIARYVLLSSTLLSIGLAIISYPIILVFFGDSYVYALKPLFCLLPGIVLLSVSRVLSNDIASRGKPEYNLYTSFLILLLNITFNILLIPTFGISGAAIATTISYSINTLIKLFQYSSLSKNKWYLPFKIDIQDFLLFKYHLGKINHQKY